MTAVSLVPRNAKPTAWLCGCGERAPADGRMYPICPSCGARMRLLDAHGLPFVGSQAISGAEPAGGH